MQTYLVGGAVRDGLLNRPVVERDWVIVGATEQQMLDAGYKRVGRDFPVFLHPTTHDECALARTERKTAAGYRGFSVHATPDVTLEEDLLRRDLTINAIAQDIDGQLVDPYGGQQDLEKRLLRHVSPAFAEDPVRILRVARFAARYAPLGFTVAPETMALMQQMVLAGEVDALVAERVWQELVRALAEPRPRVFIEVLRNCGALARILPEVDALFGVPQTAKWHPEIDTGEHILLALDQVALLTDRTEIRFAVLVHDLGKGLTPLEYLPSHRGHEKTGLPLVEAVCKRLAVPTAYQRLALKVCEYHLLCHKAFELKNTTLLKLLQHLDVFRAPQDFSDYLLACLADVRGRKGLQEQPYPQVDLLRAVAKAASSVQPAELDLTGLKGPQIAELIYRERLKQISQVDREQYRT